MEPKEKIEWAISELEKTTNFSVIAEMKAMMNSVYGEGRNQIAKPTVQGILNEWNSMDPSNDYLKRVGLLEGERITGLLQTTCPSYFPYHAIIHFPEVTITNDSKSHKIVDIYVRFGIKMDGKIYPHIQGLRTTVTEAEYLTNYLHSHLPRLDSNKICFNYFCTGVGEINQIMAILGTNYTSANFMMFLMHIKNFLEWESKEGNPYMYLSSISRRSGRINADTNHLPDWAANKTAKKLVEKIQCDLSVEQIMKMFQFIVTERSIVVKAKSEAEKWLASEIQKWDIRGSLGINYRHRELICIKDNVGVYHMLPEDIIQGREPYDGTILNFKGQEIKFQIINKSQVEKYETFANPKITKETCEELSRIFTKIAFTTPGIKSGSSLTHNTGTSESDNILVQQSLDGGMVGNALL